ncbi:hypothetical protein AB0P19_10465 [Microbacterium oleivorans]|uniref:hypothetical protein n=1 Tax=Microbacterium oleivorans TaxID=273677 RepID=UPI0033CB37D9
MAGILAPKTTRGGALGGKMKVEDFASEGPVTKPGEAQAAFTRVMLGVQILLVVASVVLIPFQAMRSAVCDAQCDFAAAETALTVGVVATVSILVLTVIVLAVRRFRPTRSWLVVLAGIGLTMAAMFTSNEFFKAALPPM